MHVWIVEVKTNYSGKWIIFCSESSRILARQQANYQGAYHYKTRVVKYISTKGE